MADTIKIKTIRATLLDPMGTEFEYELKMDLMNVGESRVLRSDTLYTKKWSTQIEIKEATPGVSLVPNGAGFDRKVDFCKFKDGDPISNVNEEALELEFNIKKSNVGIQKDELKEIETKKKGKIKIRDSKFPPPTAELQSFYKESEKKGLVISKLELNKTGLDKENKYNVSASLTSKSNPQVMQIRNENSENFNEGEMVLAIIEDEDATSLCEIDFNDEKFNSGGIAIFVINKAEAQAAPISKSYKQALIKIEN